MNYKSYLILCLMFLIVFSGCGDDSPVEIPATTVSGTVFQKGTPAEAFVAFYSYNQNSLSASGLSVPYKTVNSAGAGCWQIDDVFILI